MISFFWIPALSKKGGLIIVILMHFASIHPILVTADGFFRCKIEPRSRVAAGIKQRGQSHSQSSYTVVWSVS